jgi:hypothetical protein
MEVEGTRRGNDRCHGSEINDPLTHGAGVCGDWADLVNLAVKCFF